MKFCKLVKKLADYCNILHINCGNKKTNAQYIGNFGENLAKKFLKKEKKYKILEKNWRHKNSEIDIIALDYPVVVFVEVRTRQKNALVQGYFSVSKKKKQALKPACNQYILENNLKFFRFDIIEINYSENDKNFDLFHYENIPFF